MIYPKESRINQENSDTETVFSETKIVGKLEIKSPTVGIEAGDKIKWLEINLTLIIILRLSISGFDRRFTLGLAPAGQIQGRVELCA